MKQISVSDETHKLLEKNKSIGQSYGGYIAELVINENKLKN